VTNSYSIVTITFCEELDLLRLQARSLTLYLPPKLIGEIIVIANEPPAMPTGWRDSVLKAYGHFRSRVRFLQATDLTSMPIRSGWFSQQVLKLLAANHVSASHYLILDSKNHLVFPFSDHYLPAEGKPRMPIHFYRATHSLRPYLFAALDYFDLSHDVAQPFLPTTTPYIVQTDICREMMHYMAEREQQPFEQTFLQRKPRLTEFFLYAAYLLTKGSFKDFYEETGMYGLVVWKELAPFVEEVNAIIHQCESAKIPFFAVHRVSLSLLNQRAQRLIASFWTRRGLFPDTGSAVRFLTK
jgi:hypothetical protein